MTEQKLVTLGARGSTLSMWQANWILDKLSKAAPNHSYEITAIKTLGDKIQNAALSKIGSTGLFTKEIERELLEGRIDLAVHSLKDLPTEPHPGLAIIAVGPREDPRDVLVSKNGLKLSELRAGSVVGTSSLRRKAQILNLRPDLEVTDLRGNVDTRLNKALSGDYDAIVLAAAGVIRVGRSDAITEYLSPDVFVPAIGQGVIAIEIRDGDPEMAAVAETVRDLHCEQEISAERALMHVLQGGCQVPVGALAEVTNDRLTIHGVVASLDGKQLVRDQLSGPSGDAYTIGSELACRLKAAGADEILDEIRAVVSDKWASSKWTKNG